VLKIISERCELVKLCRINYSFLRHTVFTVLSYRLGSKFINFVRSRFRLIRRIGHG